MWHLMLEAVRQKDSNYNRVLADEQEQHDMTVVEKEIIKSIHAPIKPGIQFDWIN